MARRFYQERWTQCFLRESDDFKHTCINQLDNKKCRLTRFGLNAKIQCYFMGVIMQGGCANIYLNINIGAFFAFSWLVRGVWILKR